MLISLRLRGGIKPEDRNEILESVGSHNESEDMGVPLALPESKKPLFFQKITLLSSLPLRVSNLGIFRNEEYFNVLFAFLSFISAISFNFEWDPTY